jgi:signal transduction histidine kinase
LLPSEVSLETVGGRLIQAQEQERASIALELRHHIDSLVALSIDLDSLKQALPQALPETRREIEEARRQIKNIVKDIHGLSHRLHSLTLEYLGLAPAAASFCKDLCDCQNVKIDFHSEGVPKLSKEIALCLYRVLQEALQNALTHSGGRVFEVSLSGQLNEIQLSVRDWGIGFDPVAAMKGRGIGLIKMKERVKLVDGELSIESQSQRGTTIHARVPLKKHDEVPHTVGIVRR